MPAITSTNVATAIVKLVAADALPALVSNLVMGNLVNRDYEPTLAQAGDTVNVPIPPTLVANNIAEGGTVTTQNPTLGNAQIVLNTHAEATFQIPDVTKVLAVPDLLRVYMQPAVIAIAERIESDLLGLYASFSANTPVGIAVRGDLFDLPPAVADVRHGARLLQARLNGFGGSPHGRAGKRHVEEFISQAIRNKKFIRVQIAPRRVVRMQAMHGDALARRAGGLGECLAELVIPAVADSHPVERTQDDGLFCREQHHSAGRELIDDFLRRRDQRVAQGSPDRGSNIGLEDGNFERRFFGLQIGRR